MAREMQDSGIEWLGSFPLEWEWVPLWSLIKCRISGSWGDDPKNDNNDRACMRIADFDYDNLSFKKDLVPTMRNYSIEEIENKALSYGIFLHLCIAEDTQTFILIKLQGYKTLILQDLYVRPFCPFLV